MLDVVRLDASDERMLRVRRVMPLIARRRWRRCCPPSFCCRRSRPTAPVSPATPASRLPTTPSIGAVGSDMDAALRDGLIASRVRSDTLRHRGDRRDGARRRVRDLRRPAPVGMVVTGLLALIILVAALICRGASAQPVLRHRARHRRRRVRALLPADRRHQVRRDRRRGSAGALAQARRLAGAAEHLHPAAGVDRSDPRHDTLDHAPGRRGGRAAARASRRTCMSRSTSRRAISWATR